MSDPPHDAPPPLDYAAPERQKWSWPQAGLIAGIVIMAVLNAAMIVSAIVPSSLHGRSHDRAHSRLIQCQSRLRMIGLAIQYYANENGDHLPPDLREVLRSQPVTSDDFICPASGDTAAVGPTTQQTAALLLSPNGHHCSYFYVGAGLTASTVLPDHVLAFELPANHGGGMANVLFGDYHVERVTDAARLANLQADCAAGVRPIKLRP